MKRIIICLILLVSCTIILDAEESWQGNAAVAHQGEFGTQGLYAASNSFPENTVVKVRNLENGKSVDVTIRRRIEGSAGLFLLLSENAAAVIGMGKTDIVPVETRIIGISKDLTGEPYEFVYNPDTDVNPSAGTPNLTDINKDTTRPDTTHPDTTQHDTTQHDTVRPDVTHPDTTVTKSGDPFADRNPQKDMFSTPHSDNDLSVNDRVAPEHGKTGSAITKLDEATVAPADRGKADSLVRPDMPDDDVVALLVEPGDLKREKADISSVKRPGNDYTGPEVALLDAKLQDKDIPTVEEIQRMDRQREDVALNNPDYPGVRKADRASVNERKTLHPDREELAMKDHSSPEIKPKDTTHPDTVGPDSVGPTGPVTTRTELALVPTGPRPPSTDSDTYSPRTTTPVVIPENLDRLAKKNYYLQLGVYKTKSEAEKVAGLHKNYPMEVITASVGGYSVYKVVVGPLKKDESGTVLYLFKADGYKDAFIRYVD